MEEVHIAKVQSLKAEIAKVQTLKIKSKNV